MSSVLCRVPMALLAATVTTVAWAAPALKVEESAVLDAPPATVWKLMGGYAAVDKWHPAVASSPITKGKDNVRGAVRTITTRDGARIVEELLAYDGRGRSMRYRILESPLPVTDYEATLSVKPDGKGSRVVWKGQFNRNDTVDDAKAKDIFAGIYRAGFDGARARLAEGGNGQAR